MTARNPAVSAKQSARTRTKKGASSSRKPMRRKAGLWDERETVKRENASGDWQDIANPSPWYRYPRRMLAWRAAGYCLRELFGDLLGGVRDEFEMREIASVRRAAPAQDAAAVLPAMSAASPMSNKHHLSASGRAQRVPPSPPPEARRGLASMESMENIRQGQEVLLERLQVELKAATDEAEVDEC